MPTLTRLATMVLFGVMTLFVGAEYQLLYEEPPESIQGNVFLALVAAGVGWTFVGPRIDRSFLRAFWLVVQGYIATLILALILYGFYDIFTQGYAMRYRTLDDAFAGAFRIATEHVTRMADTQFLILLLGMAVVITIIATIVFRVAEARRLER